MSFTRLFTIAETMTHVTHFTPPPFQHVCYLLKKKCHKICVPTASQRFPEANSSWLKAKRLFFIDIPPHIGFIILRGYNIYHQVRWDIYIYYSIYNIYNPPNDSLSPGWGGTVYYSLTESIVHITHWWKHRLKGSVS